MDKKQEIIQELRRVANAISPEVLTSKKFQRVSRIPLSTIRYHFGSYNQAVVEAGLKPNELGIPVLGYKSLNENDLFAEIRILWIAVGKRPTESQMNAQGKYSVKPFRDRWGSFSMAVDEFLKRFGVPERNNNSGISNDTTKGATPVIIPKTYKPKKRIAMKKRILYGEPIDFRGLRYGPCKRTRRCLSLRNGK